MRRKPGTLLPLEVAILAAGMAMRAQGTREFHGFQLAKAMSGGSASGRLTGYGTLYEALERLEGGGLLASRWEDPQQAASAGRPRRRFYSVTMPGAKALNQSEAQAGPDSKTISAAAAAGV
jgi:PadR family transcriptional regulator, regulatory protein PadR